MKISMFKKEIESYLEEYFKDKGSYNKLIYEASSYSLNIGGKRIRPVFTMLTYNLYNDDYKDILPVAAAIEMIHTYSLIHDDLPAMDNDDLRRGKPTNHKVYGEGMAILAGDALLNEAMIVLTKYSLEKGVPALRATKEIIEAAGTEGMIGGQVVDILSENKDLITIEELEYMHSKKTGALIKASIISGAIVSEAPKTEIDKLSLFGEKLGLAFQIKDDILDVVGDVEKMGKNPNQDETCNKNNFITMFGLEKCEDMCRQLTVDCVEILKSIEKDTHYLEELTLKLLDREK